MSRLLEAKNGNIEKQDRHRELDSPINSQDGEGRGHIGRYYQRKDEENMNTGASDICKPTDLTGHMTPGHCPMGGHQHWLGHRAG